MSDTTKELLFWLLFCIAWGFMILFGVNHDNDPDQGHWHCAASEKTETTITLHDGGHKFPVTTTKEVCTSYVKDK